MVVLEWEHQLLLEASGMCREAAGMLEEGPRRTRRDARVWGFHIPCLGAQSTGFEKPGTHLLAVQPKSYRPQRSWACSFWKGGGP